MNNYQRRMFIIKHKQRAMENTLSKTEMEAKEKAITLNSRRTNVFHNGLWQDKTISPSWENLESEGYSIAKLELTEV